MMSRRRFFHEDGGRVKQRVHGTEMDARQRSEEGNEVCIGVIVEAGVWVAVRRQDESRVCWGREDEPTKCGSASEVLGYLQSVRRGSVSR